MTIDLDRRLVSGRTSYFDYKNQNGEKKATFKGAGDWITTALIASDKYPMVGVSIIDVTSMIGPRTVIDATRNGFAATETFLRESSGLIINCLAPSVVVLGAAALINKAVMGEKFNNIKDLNAHKIWANEDSINTVAEAWNHHSDITDPVARKEATLKRILGSVEGLVGKNDEWKKITTVENLDSHITDIAKAMHGNDSKAFEKHVDTLIEKFGASRTIRLSKESGLGPISCNFKELTRDIKDLTTSFAKIEGHDLKEFTGKLLKLVNRKSIIGLAAIMSLGSGVQWLNRHVTKKRSGCDGFVGDPNFGKGASKKEKTPAEKAAFKFQKLIGAAAMMGLLVLSFKGKRPNMKMFQFNGLFPTMDQCRLISASTFTGRILASEDKNELRETTLRDMFGFANLYFLGDYVSKFVATKILDKDNKLKLSTSTVKETPGQEPGMFKKITNWIYKTDVKGFEELATKEAKSAKAWSQAAGLIYSCIALGLAVPLYNKWKTNKNVNEKQKAQEGQVPANTAPSQPVVCKPTMKGRESISTDAAKIYSAFVNN